MLVIGAYPVSDGEFRSAMGEFRSAMVGGMVSDMHILGLRWARTMLRDGHAPD